MSMLVPVLDAGHSGYSFSDVNNTTVMQPSGSQVWRACAWSPVLRLFAACGGNIGSSGVLATSPDGVNWTQRTVPDSGQMLGDVIWVDAFGMFLAFYGGKTTGGVIGSTDGVNWPAVGDLPVLMNAWESGPQAYSPSLGLLAAVGFGVSPGAIVTTPDGINWTSRTVPATNTSWNSIAWGEGAGVYVAIAFNGGAGSPPERFATSPNGVDWTPRSPTGSFVFEDIAWGDKPGVFVVCHQSGAFQVSGNGIDWSAVSPGVTGNINQVRWIRHLGIFLATMTTNTAGNNKFLTSEDGVNWDIHDSSSDLLYKGLAVADHFSPEVLHRAVQPVITNDTCRVLDFLPTD